MTKQSLEVWYAENGRELVRHAPSKAGKADEFFVVVSFMDRKEVCELIAALRDAVGAQN